MGKLAKPANRLLFALCVLITGAIAGAFVWAFFFCMDIGLGRSCRRRSGRRRARRFRRWHRGRSGSPHGR